MKPKHFARHDRKQLAEFKSLTIQRRRLKRSGDKWRVQRALQRMFNRAVRSLSSLGEILFPSKDAK